MGDVRREGEWRFEKIREGVYDVTFQAEPQVRVITPEAPTDEHDPPLLGAAPVRHVSSSSDARELFEERSRGPPPEAAGSLAGSATGDGPPVAVDTGVPGLDDVPPIGLGAVSLLVGGFLVAGFWSQPDRIPQLIGLAFLAAGLFPFLYAGHLFRTDGWRTARGFLGAGGASDERTGSATEDGETVSPPAEK